MNRTMDDSSNWMTRNQALLHNKKLSQICLPGSHDSGTFKVTHKTEFGSMRNTQTQLLDIEAQLRQGIRCFDLRPALYAGHFYTAHCTDLPGLGYQGAVGVALTEAFGQIRSFLGQEENRSELVIIDFSHFIDWQGGLDRKHLLERFEPFILDFLGETLVQGVAGDLANKTVDGLINDSGAGRRNVIALSACFEASDKNTRQGLWNSGNFNMEGKYSDTNDLPKMMAIQKGRLLNFNRASDADLFQLCWQLTLSPAQSSNPNSPSILDLAEDANPALFPNIETWIREGVIDKSMYPNIINTDACCEANTRAVELALRICNLAHH